MTDPTPHDDGQRRWHEMLTVTYDPDGNRIDEQTVYVHGTDGDLDNFLRDGRAGERIIFDLSAADLAAPLSPDSFHPERGHADPAHATDMPLFHYERWNRACGPPDPTVGFWIGPDGTPVRADAGLDETGWEV